MHFFYLSGYLAASVQIKPVTNSTNHTQCAYAVNRLNQPPAEEDEIDRQQHEKLIGQLKYVDRYCISVYFSCGN